MRGRRGGNKGERTTLTTSHGASAASASNSTRRPPGWGENIEPCRRRCRWDRTADVGGSRTEQPGVIRRQGVGKQPSIVDVPPSEMAADRKQLPGPDVGELAVWRHVQVHCVKPVDGSGGIALGDEVGGWQLALPISPGIVGVCDELAVPEARFDGCAVAVTVDLHGSEGGFGHGWWRRRR